MKFIAKHREGFLTALLFIIVFGGFAAGRAMADETVSPYPSSTYLVEGGTLNVASSPDEELTTVTFKSSQDGSQNTVVFNKEGETVGSGTLAWIKGKYILITETTTQYIDKWTEDKVSDVEGDNDMGKVDPIPSE